MKVHSLHCHLLSYLGTLIHNLPAASLFRLFWQVFLYRTSLLRKERGGGWGGGAVHGPTHPQTSQVQFLKKSDFKINDPKKQKNINNIKNNNPLPAALSPVTLSMWGELLPLLPSWHRCSIIAQWQHHAGRSTMAVNKGLSSASANPSKSLISLYQREC